jgi:hypothetical protein
MQTKFWRLTITAARLPLFEIALVFVGFDHVASIAMNANQGMLRV